MFKSALQIWTPPSRMGGQSNLPDDLGQEGQVSKGVEAQLLPPAITQISMITGPGVSLWQKSLGLLTAPSASPCICISKALSSQQIPKID